MNANTCLLTLFAFLCLCISGVAEEQAPKPIPVTDAAKIEAKLGETATIQGKVTRVGQSKGGIHFLNFANYHFVVVCFPDAVSKFENGTPSDLYKDRTIAITGKIEKYKDKFQIKLTDPKQVRIVEATTELTEDAGEPKPAEAPAEKEKNKPAKKPVDPKRFFDC